MVSIKFFSFGVFLNIILSQDSVKGFQTPLIWRHSTSQLHETSCCSQLQMSLHNSIRDDNSMIIHPQSESTTVKRRDIFHSLALVGLTWTVSSDSARAAESVSEILEQIQTAKKQLDPVPDLIKNEQWDGVRAILLKPPLSDCWTKSSKKVPLLQSYAENVANDEFTALEIKEELQGHLRYLDMAVYNNVFNPIKSMGTAGATKELIRSYYEDPINEYKASIKYFDELIQLASP